MHKSAQPPYANRSTPYGRTVRGPTDDFRNSVPPTTSSSIAFARQEGQFLKPPDGSTIVAPKPMPISRVIQSRKRSGSTIASISSTQHTTSDLANSISNASSETLATRLTPQPEKVYVPNILVFGETGVGKSSVINMIAGSDVAGVSSSAVGCTLKNQCYVVSLAGQQVRLWDTAGLNEGDRGNVPAEQAMQHLRDLVGTLSEGISLLLYCVRGTSRFRDVLKTNYDLFWGTICDKRVPIVIVVTGLEHQVPMESWWDQNVEQFDRNGMTFEGHACITATRGKPTDRGVHMYEAEFEESKVTARNLVSDHFARSPARWISDREAWLSDISLKLAKYYGTAEGARPVAVELNGPQWGWTQTRLWCMAFVVCLLLGTIFALVKVLNGR